MKLTIEEDKLIGIMITCSLLSRLTPEMDEAHLEKALRRLVNSLKELGVFEEKS